MSTESDVSSTLSSATTTQCISDLTQNDCELYIQPNTQTITKFCDTEVMAMRAFFSRVTQPSDDPIITHRSDIMILYKYLREVNNMLS